MRTAGGIAFVTVVAVAHVRAAAHPPQTVMVKRVGMKSARSTDVAKPTSILATRRGRTASIKKFREDGTLLGNHRLRTHQEMRIELPGILVAVENLGAARRLRLRLDRDALLLTDTICSIEVNLVEPGVTITEASVIPAEMEDNELIAAFVAGSGAISDPDHWADEISKRGFAHLHLAEHGVSVSIQPSLHTGFRTLTVTGKKLEQAPYYLETQEQVGFEIRYAPPLNLGAGKP
jgi:hypothetical protein